MFNAMQRKRFYSQCETMIDGPRTYSGGTEKKALCLVTLRRRS
jgi:hypothetical protein